MPELPEIETLKLGLTKYIKGRTIEDIEIKVPKIFQGDKRDVVGAKIENIKRIGKGIIIELDNDFVLAVHLKLTGQLVYVGKETQGKSLSPKTGGTLPSKFTHVIFTLDPSTSSGQASYLYYNDVRRFGWIKLMHKDDIMSLPFFKEMGPEPDVTGEITGKPLTFNYFKNVVKKARVAIKILIMDQKRIGGIGNIYANDALFMAGIDPRRSANSLSDVEIKRLYDSIFTVLEEGLKYGGSSDVNYVHADGGEGNYQFHTLVYGRTGKPCLNCSGTVKKIYLGGRGTFFCPSCQK